MPDSAVMSSAPVLFVFAKEPRAGTVKTRLAPVLGPEQAAQCQRAFTTDLVRRLAAYAPEAGVTVRLAAAPDGDAPVLCELARSAGVELVWQGDGDLGERMERALAAGCAEAGAALVVGSDVPDMPLTRIDDAVAALAAGEVPLGPCPDGGYYLIGCDSPVPPVFRLDTPWSAEQVLAETLRRLEEADRPCRVLEAWEDVDDPPALARIAVRLQSHRDVSRELMQTARTLARLRVRGTPR